MEPRIREIAKKCRNRGGNCDCGIQCQAQLTLSQLFIKATCVERDAKREREQIENSLLRISTPIATLRPDAMNGCPKGWQPVMVFDGGEDAYFVFENPVSDERIDADWPFVGEGYVWFDDCTQNGIRVEQA